MAGFPHSETLGSQSVYRLPEAYRRFPRPSSAPDAKASTMRSYTLTHPCLLVVFVCAKKTLSVFTRKITLHHNTFVLLMLASTIRFSNHYQTPPTHQNTQSAGLWTGRSCWLKPRPRLSSRFVIPGPNNVPVLAHQIPPTSRHVSWRSWVGERKK